MTMRSGCHSAAQSRFTPGALPERWRIHRLNAAPKASRHGTAFAHCRYGCVPFPWRVNSCR
jgi:hypothetical protein